MELRNLHRRARPFRYFAFWSMAVVSLLLFGTGREPLLILAVAAVCVVWPPLADCRHRRAADTVADDAGPVGARPVAARRAAARRAARTHLVECVFCGVLFGCLSVPPLAALGATLALLAGVTAQAGWSLLAAAVPMLAFGVGAGLVAAPTLTTASTALADVAAAVFAVGFTVALAQVSFRQAQRLHARERSAAGRVRTLESMTGRMEPYLAPSLRARIQAASDREDGSGRRDRRFLTVAFVDLVGFTELATRVEAETLAPLLDEYLSGVCELALRQGGEVTKMLGDGVLVAFGLDGPVDRRAAAAGAVRFCRELLPLLDALARSWRARGDLIELKVRIGVASGHCTVGDWGGSGYRDFSMIGSPVNLASRLQAVAPVGNALLDPTTAALVEDAVSLGAPAEVEVRGLGLVVVRALAAWGDD